MTTTASRSSTFATKHFSRSQFDAMVLEAVVKRLQDTEGLDITPLGMSWRRRAAMHLMERVDRELREGAIRPSTDAAALDMLRGLGRALRLASVALDDAAYQLRECGGGVHAGRAKAAAVSAKAAASVVEP